MPPAPQLFPFAEYWWFYAGFLVLVCGLLALDLGVFHRRSHAVSMREAGAWTVVWVSLARVFNVGFYFFMRWRFAVDTRLTAQDAATHDFGFNVEEQVIDGIGIRRISTDRQHLNCLA